MGRKCRHQKQVGSVRDVAKNRTADLTRGIGIMPFVCVACSSVGDALWNFLLVEDFLPSS
jgi:hypothetical protein